MATFKFGRAIDIHWNGYDIQGPADTVFSIPDQLYEEFDADISPVEPTLVWLDTNEFQTLSNSVSVTTLTGTIPISVTTTTSGKVVSISSTSNPAGYTLVADGTGGVIFQAGSTGALTSVVGVSPISSVISGNTASVSIDQALLSVADASTATTLRTYVKNGSGSTINKGSVVYVTGADGTNALIDLATASTEAGSSKVLGIAASTMTNNAFGYVIENGQLSNIDTSSATAGSSVWLGNTLGSYVFNSPPAEPSNSVYLGVVTKANPSTGEVLVKVQNGYELDELHDVYVGGVSTALPLVYNSTSSGWIAQALTSVGIADNAIVGSKIIDGAVTSGKIASGAVNSSILADNAVVAAKISSGAVGSAAIAAGAVNTSAINSGAATSGQLLQANGLGAAVFATIPSGASVNISEFTASGTWTKPSGATAVYVFAVGAGGGGGGGATDGAGGGGSGGGVEQRIFDASILGSTESVTIGSGGIGGTGIAGTANTSSNGTGGGSTTFGTITTGLLFAHGGSGGQCSNNDVVASTTRAAAVSNGGSGDTITNTLTVMRYSGRGGRAGTNSSTANINAGHSQTGAGGGGGGGLVSASGGEGGRGISGNNGTVTAGGAAGANGSNATILYFGGGGGGGGNTATGGNGGTGLRGGGGGGGGRANTTGGNGAAGGNGYCLVISW